MSFVTDAIGDVVGGLTGANAQAKAAGKAANTESAAAQSGINQQIQSLNDIRALQSPFLQAGTNAIPSYQNAISGYGGVLDNLNNLTGANGNAAQQTAINGLTSNPLYTSSMNLGQQAILANASATGGLRGGNTIASLGYLPNQVLSNVMQQQIGNLGSSLQGSAGLAGLYGNLVGLGSNTANTLSNAEYNTGSSIANLAVGRGTAQAGANLAQGNATASGLNSLGSLFGGAAGIGNLLGINGASSSSLFGLGSFGTPALLNAGGINPSSYGVGSNTYGFSMF